MSSDDATTPAADGDATGRRDDAWVVRPRAREVAAFTGERFVPGVGGEIEAEHLSRYLFAAPLCAGRRVLDIACGEGFGSAMLAGVAKEVVGMDIDAPTIELARRNYGADGDERLSFAVGSCEKIPAKRGSFDVVVSFETIEHIEDQTGFLREVRRVLRPGGVFVCSTPDKSVYLAGQAANPFHKKELTAAEFEKLLSGRFEHAAFFGQRLVSGAVITRGDSGRTELVKTGDGLGFERSHAGEGATYRVAVCSDARLPRVADQVFSDARYSIGRLTRLASERDGLAERGAQLAAELAGVRQRLDESDHAARHRAAELEQAARRAKADADRAAEHAARLADQRDRAIAARDQASAEVARLSEDRGRLIAERASAERERDAAIRDAASAQVDYQRAAGELERVRESMLEAREKAAAAQAGLAAVKSEHATLRQAAERAGRERDSALDAQKQAEIHAARMEERALRPAGVLAVAGRAASVRGLGLAARVARTLRLPGAERLSVARRAALFRASRLFDPGAYLRANPDVAAAGVDPAWHLAARGGIEQRRVPPGFDGAWYLRANPDVAAAGVHPFEHYITRGVIEGRAGLPPEGGEAALLAAGAKAGPMTASTGVVQAPRIEIAPPSTAPEESLKIEVDPAQREKTKVLAFYLPQFHPIPENDAWWGKGFTEWTNVARGRPMFAGHRQPFLPGELGFYDLRVPEVRERQAELARAAGIHGFCYHHYWFNGRRVLERPLAEVLASGSPDFPFCVCWANENWTRRWDGHEQEVLLRQQHTLAGDRRFILDLMPYLEDPRHVRVDGRPVIVVYRPDLMADARDTAAVWRDECRRAGVGDIHLCAVQFRTTDPGPLGFDAAVEFPPHHFPAPEITKRVPGMDPDFGGSVFDYEAGVHELVRTPRRAAYRLYRGVMPSWDNTARRMEHAIVHRGATPELYEAWLRSAINQRQPDDGVRENLVFVNAWNEWAEGTVLEPRKDLGDAYLQATARALGVTRAPVATPDLRSAPAEPGLDAATAAPEPASRAGGAGLEDRLKRVVRTNATLNSFVNRHPELKSRTGAVIRRLVRPEGGQAEAVPLPSPGPTRGSRVVWRGRAQPDGPGDRARLLVVSHDAALAGAQLILLENLAHWTGQNGRAGVDCRVLLLGSGDLEPRFAALAPTACIDDLGTRSKADAATRVLADLKSAGWTPDAAFCNTVASVDAAEALAGAGVPVLSAVYELPTSIDDGLGGRRVVERVMRSSARVMVASAFVRDRLAEAYRVSPERLEPVHTGVLGRDLPDRGAARASIRRELEVGDDALVVLGCGSVHHRKGADLFVGAAARAFAALAGPDAPEMVFAWVGDDQTGPTFRNWCLHDIERCGLGGKVRFVGKRADPSAWFAGADIFALTSREDPFPMVNLEALRAGLAVAAFEGGGGAPEALGPDRAVLSPYAEAGAMGDAIAALARDRDRLHAMRHAARAFAAEHLGWDRYMAQINAMLAESCSDRFAGVGADRPGGVGAPAR